MIIALINDEMGMMMIIIILIITIIIIIIIIRVTIATVLKTEPRTHVNFYNMVVPNLFRVDLQFIEMKFRKFEI